VGVVPEPLAHMLSERIARAYPMRRQRQYV
jgi:hypothetical protein